MEYDLIIVGGGPGGLTAGLYGARSGLRVLVLEKAIAGGKITTADVVENYPGFPDGIGGFDLGQLMHQQAEKQGIETVYAEATSIELQDKLRVVKTSEGDYRAAAVIVASGAEYAKLGVPGEQELTGKGVSYCATCDGAFFK
ncbi:MAG: FAD-dependent oxidoreductase, partial [Chloroflexota bacterium]|nr:FAD-dependent oxidoreductase [Chloroflexota bacterium]